MSSSEILKYELDKLAEELTQKHIALGMKASGKWIESLRVEVNETEGTLWGEDYTKYLIEGRPPGKFPPIKLIEKWIYDKGISLVDIKINQLAFLIARKIAEKGTDYYIKGGTDLIDSVITEERIKKISEAFGMGILIDIEELIKNEMNYV